VTNQVLPDTLTAQLANCVDYWGALGVESRGGGPTPWFRSGLNLSLLNGVRRSTATDLSTVWDEISEGLTGIDWGWWVGEDSTPQTGDMLTARGCAKVGELPHLAVDPREVHPAPVAGLTIREVTAEADVLPWTRMWTVASGLPAATTRVLAEVELTRLALRTDHVCLAGYLDGEVVGSAVMSTSHGVGGLYVVSTRADLRRHGIGRSMTAAAVAAARERELPVVGLQSTPEGLPLYLSMGFRQISRYELFSPPPAGAR
jgi:GNAT superfamily N-acetyltransferase